MATVIVLLQLYVKATSLTVNCHLLNKFQICDENDIVAINKTLVRNSEVVHLRNIVDRFTIQQSTLVV